MNTSKTQAIDAICGMNMSTAGESVCPRPLAPSWESSMGAAVDNIQALQTK